MSAGSWRRRPLPSNWGGPNGLRMQCLRRDRFRCQWPGAAQCPTEANQADHIDPDGPDELWNLRSLCAGHHQARSSSQGGQAWGAIRARMSAQRFRKQERHPGLIDAS